MSGVAGPTAALVYSCSWDGTIKEWDVPSGAASSSLSAAKAAGMNCVVTKSSYTENEDFTKADDIVPELGDEADSGVTIEKLKGIAASA